MQIEGSMDLVPQVYSPPSVSNYYLSVARLYACTCDIACPFFVSGDLIIRQMLKSMLSSLVVSNATSIKSSSGLLLLRLSSALAARESRGS